MKKPKVICDHYHLCKELNYPQECLHEVSHKYKEDACSKGQCDFLMEELNNNSYVHCNQKRFRKEKLEKLNEKNESNL